MFRWGNSKNRSRAGFSLSEVMVATVFLSLAAFAILSINVYTLQATRGNRNREMANRLAASQLSVAEAVLRINFHASPTSINTDRLGSEQYQGFEFLVEDLGYENAQKDLRSVRCRVFWNESGAARAYQLETTLYGG
ncbi:MAG: hypothetical protein U0931_35760 [Vulcanimicrobiota bacterium]